MGITLGSNFSVNTNLPLDDRNIVADLTARDAITSGRRFIGMSVHCLADSKNYQLVNGIDNANWADISAVPATDVPYVANSSVNIFSKTMPTLDTAKVSSVGARPSGSVGFPVSPVMDFTYTHSDVDGSNMITITKSAANAQGEYIRVPLNIGNSQRTKVMNVRFDISYSGSYVQPTSSTDGSLIAYLEITDGVTAIFEQLSTVQINAVAESTGYTTSFQATFQVRSESSTSPFLMLYCPRTETTAWNAYVRNLQILPLIVSGSTRQVIFMGYVGSNFAISSSTPLTLTTLKDTHGAWSTNTYTVKEAGDYRLTLNTAITAGTDNIQIYKNGAGVKLAGGVDTAFRTLSTVLENCKVDDTIQIRSSSAITIVGNGNATYIIEKVDAGDASQSSLGIVDFIAYKPSNEAVTASSTQIAYTAIKDSHGAWNGNQYIVKVAGDYTVIVNGSASASGDIVVYINGAARRNIFTITSAANTSGTAIVPNLNVDDVLTIRCGSSITINGSAANTTHAGLYIRREPSLSLVAPSNNLLVSYSNTAGSALSSTDSDISFPTKEIDVFNSYDGTTFTAPESAAYEFSACIETGSFNPSAGSELRLGILVNGSTYYKLGSQNAFAAGTAVVMAANGSKVVRLLQNQTVKFRVRSATASNMTATAGYNHMSIKRVGNY